MAVVIGLLSLEMEIPGCKSLKEKRSRIKPLLARLHREFNISAAELGALDTWNRSVIGCALLCNDHAQAQRILEHICQWLDQHWHDVQVIDHQIELR
jgi:hypothetical protein